MGKKRGGAGLGGAVPVVRSGGVPVLGPREGDDALLFAAGMKAQAASSQEASPAPTATPAPDYFLPDDGVVSLAAAQEPQASVTPDPSRSYAPVEEIQLSGGAQVGNSM